MRTIESATARPAALLTHPVLRQLVKFALVGVANTGITLAVYALLVWIGVWYIAASALAFALGAVNSYSLNRIWTFRAGAFERLAFARYVVVQLIALGLDTGLLYLLVHTARVDRILAQALVLPVVSLTTFVLARQWAFGLPAGDAVSGGSGDGR